MRQLSTNSSLEEIEAENPLLGSGPQSETVLSNFLENRKKYLEVFSANGKWKTFSGNDFTYS